MTWINMLGPLGWLLLALVPIGIFALYFLKLRRQPLEVPSTFLWSKAIEDMHVNSLWQKLRRSLLLLLQLLVVLAVILAVLRPGFQGQALVGERFVFLIDNSASMLAEDVEDAPNRLEKAKREVAQLIDQMKSGDVAMVATFSDVARIEQPFTGDIRALQRKLNAIEAVPRSTDIGDALRMVTGLITDLTPPGPTGEEEEQEPPPPTQTASLYILSDGGFGGAETFTLDDLDAQYVAIGNDDSTNFAVLNFRADRNADRDDQLQAFAQVRRFGPGADELTANLLYNGELLDVSRIKLDEEGRGGVQFDLGPLDSGALKLELDVTDNLAVDNVAYAAINPPQRSRVLVVSSGNEFLRLALATDEIQRLADITFVEPTFLEQDQYKQEAAAGRYGLIIYERATPEEMPEASTLFLGVQPPGETWSTKDAANLPEIIDVMQSHPLLKFVNMGDVAIYQANPLIPPTSATVLIDSDAGPLLAIAPRKSHEDAVLGFGLLIEEEGQTFFNTQWAKRLSFPVFIKNVVEYLTQGGTSAVLALRPGGQALLRADQNVDTFRVKLPDGEFRTISGVADQVFTFSQTDQLGVYEVYPGDSEEPTQLFSVNLFDPRESDLQPRLEIETQWDTIVATQDWQPARQELWKWLVLLGLGILVTEWFIYHRRVYV
ncbi:MAG: BatA and WFA domain-containing protein [Pirellulaceae bacterium]